MFLRGVPGVGCVLGEGEGEGDRVGGDVGARIGLGVAGTRARDAGETGQPDRRC